MQELKFVISDDSDVMLEVLKGDGQGLACGGKALKPLVPNTTEASQEKHIPVVKKENGMLHITVGSAVHPMVAEHYIEWISVVGPTRIVRQALKPGDTPTMTVHDGDFTSVYAYCNKHGLWKGEI